MADFADEFAASRAPQTQPGGVSFEDQFAASRRADFEAEGRLRASAATATETTPEQLAKQKYLSTVTGVPMDVVKNQEGQVKAMAKYKELYDQSATSPVLRARLQNPEFTGLAQNDGVTLSGVEHGFKVLGGMAGRTLAGATVEVGATAFDLSAYVNDLIAASTKTAAPLVEGILPINPLSQLSAAAAGGANKNREQAKAARNSIDYFLPEATNSTEAGLYSGAQSAGFNLATLPAAIEAGILNGAKSAGNVMGLIAGIATGTRTYNQGREAGMGFMEANTFAAPAAAAEYLFEKWSGGKFFDDVAARSPFLKMLFNNATREVLGEEATTLTQNFNEWMRLNPEKTVREFINEQPDAMYQTLVAALVGSGIQTGTMKGLQKFADSQNKSLVDMSELQQLQSILQTAAGSDLLAKDKATFSEFVQAAAEGTQGAPTSVFVDGPLLAQTLEQNGIDAAQLSKLMPSVQSQLADAVGMNAAVEIPIGELTTALAGTPLEQALVPHLRMRAEGMSLTEAKQEQEQAQQFLTQEAQRVIEQAADSVRTAASAETVRQTIKAQLDAVGRFSSDVNDKGAKLVSEFYTVMAGRMGMTPERVYNDLLQYKVQAQGQGALTQVDQKQLAESLPVVKTGDSVDGRTVRKDVPNMSSIGSSLNNFSVLPGVREVPLSAFDKEYTDSIAPERLDARTRKLVDDIKASGEINPLIVAFDSKGAYILEGGHRFDALIASGAKSLPAVVVLDQDTEGKLNQRANAPGLLNQSYNAQAEQLTADIEAAGNTVQDTMQIDELIDSKDIRTITLQDLIGLSIFPTIADRTAAAALYTGIDSSRLDVAIPLLGGPFFPLRESNVQADVVWANRGDGVIAQKAAKLKEGANYMLVVMGDANMHQSNSTVAAAFMGTLEAWSRDGRISTAQVEALGKMVREIGAKAVDDANVKLAAADKAVAAAKDKKALDKAKKERSQAQKAVTTNGYLENFPGFDDSGIMHAYMDGISFDARKRVLEIMASKQALEQNAPPMQKILDATREPSLAGHRWGDGVLLVEVDQTNPQVELGTEGTTHHPDFPVGVRGRVVGKLNAAINWELLWQDWLAQNADKASPRRAFELAKPIVTVTQDLVERIGKVTQANIDGPRQARLAAEFAAGNWRTSDDAVNKNGVSPQEFIDALLMSDAKDTLTQYTLADVKQGIKDGTKKIYQLGDGQIYFMLETRPDGSKYLASVVNNEKGARGIGAPAVVLKALEEGATDLDCFGVASNKYPQGFLPSLYAAFGFEVTERYGFDPTYFQPQLSEDQRRLALADAVHYWQTSTPGFDPQVGMPDAVTMKWKGDHADRKQLTERYLRGGLEGLLSGRARADAEAATAEFDAPDRAEAGSATAPDGGRVAGDQGAGAGASIASRARGTVQALASLTDNELTNLGLTGQDRAAVRHALGQPDVRDTLAQSGVPNKYQTAYLAGRDITQLGDEEITQYQALSDNPSTVAQSETEAFKRWFAGSKVVDTQGKPLVVYHGTNQTITAFDLAKIGTRDAGFFGSGFYFTPDENQALDYADTAVEDTGEGEAVAMPLYASLQNPFIWDMSDAGAGATRAALAAFGIKRDSVRGNSAALSNAKEREVFNRAVRAAGFDGVIVQDEDGVQEVVAFDPTQIKSATGNNGQYDPNNPNVLKQSSKQQARGTYDIASMTTVLNGTADLSTFLHETGHFFLDAIRRVVQSGAATPEVQAMYAGALKGLDVTEAQWEQWHAEYETTGKISEGMRAAHEKWAETFELYLFTGKAPNQEIQSLFRTFASWLKRVYQSTESFATGKGIALDADLKAVMDKMLATDEQIAEAEKIAGLLPDLDATAEAQEKLNARSMRDLQWARNALNKHIAKLQKEAKSLRAEVEAQVRAEVGEQPIYKALRFIKKGEITVDGEQIKTDKGHKLNTEAIAQMYPESMLARPDLTKLKGLTSPTGLTPDMLADALPGFASGDQLVRALIDAEPMESVVQGMTDQRMLERHGDLATPEAVAQAAIAAVHNEARAKSLATELAAQREQLNARTDTGKTNAKGAKVTVNALTAAAKQFAQNVIGRRAIKDLKKAAWAHLQAERRAGKAWEAATAKGDTQAAVQAKQDQMLNNAAVRAAQDAQDQVRKASELFKKVLKGTDEKLVERGFDPDIANAARAVLAAYGVAPAKGKTALEYLELVQKNDPAMYGAIAPSVTGALMHAKPLTDLTVDELGALTDEIESLWHLARRSRQMEIDGNLMDREDVQEELKERMEEIGIPDTMPGDTSAITPREQALRKLSAYRAMATRMENWAQYMGSAFTRYTFQPVKEAADRYRADKGRYLNKFRTLLGGIEFKRQTIEATELGYTFGKDSNGVAMAEILHAIVHTGNESNKRKLLLGRGWATENADGTLNTARWDAFVQRMVAEGVITQQHYDFAQGLWDLLEETKPLAQKTHRDVFGRYFAEVTADAFVDPFGITRRGGYAPAIADPRIVSDAATRALAEAENENMAYAFPSTNKGFTKGRVEYNRPLMLNVGTLAQHIDKVLKFSHLESPVRDVRKVLTAKGVAYGLNRIDPVAFDNIVTPWLNRAARQSVETPVAGDEGLSRIFSVVRNRAGLGAMFANVANAAQQITGFSIAAIKVKPSYMIEAAASMVKDRKAMLKNVADASIYMKERMENDVANAEAALRDILLDASAYEKTKDWSNRHAYFLQQAVDNAMGPVIWTAAYNQAVASGVGEQDAVRHADSVIRTTQGSTLPEDISRFESGPAWARVFTQFTGYFNMQANLIGGEIATVARDLGVKKGAGKMLYVVLLAGLAPAWVGEAIMQAFRGGPDDEDKDGEYLDDWLAAVFGWSTLRGATAMVPAVGPVINAAVNAFNKNPNDDRVGSAAAISKIEAAAHAPASVYKAIVGDGNQQKAVRDVSALITLATGVPVDALAKPLGYAAAVHQNKVRPTSAADAVRGAVTGVASPQSK